MLITYNECLFIALFCLILGIFLPHIVEAIEKVRKGNKKKLKTNKRGTANRTK